MEAVNASPTGPWGTWLFDQACAKDNPKNCATTSFQQHFKVKGTTDLSKNPIDSARAAYYVKVSDVIDVSKVYGKDPKELKKLKNWLYINSSKKTFDQYYAAFLASFQQGIDPGHVISSFVIPSSYVFDVDPPLPTLPEVETPLTAVVPYTESTPSVTMSKTEIPIWVYLSITGVGCIILLIVVLYVVRSSVTIV